MSEHAVFRRLQQVDGLRDLCLSLMKAKILTDAEAIELRKKNREECARKSFESNVLTEAEKIPSD